MSADTETVPIHHDRWLATINGELWDTTGSSHDLLRQVERVHHSDHTDTTARDIHVFSPGESPNWMWTLSRALPQSYQQEIEVELDVVATGVPSVTDEKLETMEGFL